jgi:pyruvate dehydrogenase complex dehydrogenase (E1) component
VKYQRDRVREENKEERKKENHEEKKFKFDEISELRDRALLI